MGLRSHWGRVLFPGYQPARLALQMDQFPVSAPDCQEYLPDHQRFKGSKGGRLKFEILGDLPIVTGDKDKLKRVFENLIVNSINHKGDKNVHILIFGKSDDQYNTICIKDNGPGIDKKYHDKIFEPFKSLDKKSGGSGIGLSIVKKIVDLHNGKIELKSSIGEGAEFCISIPNN